MHTTFFTDFRLWGSELIMRGTKYLCSKYNMSGSLEEYPSLPSPKMNLFQYLIKNFKIAEIEDDIYSRGPF